MSSLQSENFSTRTEVKSELISIVIPMHNEEGNVKFVYKEVKEVCERIRKEKGYDYEIIFVNDGSTDRTLTLLLEIKKEDPHVRILNMDQNRGEASALSAGFAYARGKFIFTMDGDGQNDPNYFYDFLQKLEEGYLVVTGKRLKRKEPLLSRRIPSLIANKIIAMVTKLKVSDNGCSLKGYRADVAKRCQIPKGFHRFLPALFGVKNEEVLEVPVIDRKRHWGKSHYGLRRTLEVLRDLITFPFLKRAEFFRKFFKVWWLLHTIPATIITILLFIYYNPLLVILDIALIIGAVVSYLIYWNLNRYLKSQIEGVFKVKEL